jgi:predicted amidophosphoribosyltransferase
LLPDRLTLIDETNRDGHSCLEVNDKCYFFGEYFAGKGFQGGGTNQLIYNYKVKPAVAKQNPQRRAYKEGAIGIVAAGLRKAVDRDSAEGMTWVPIPPSKAESDPDYDDRLLRTLNLAFAGYDVDVRQLIRQTQSTEADHSGSGRLSSEALHAVLQIDQQSLNLVPLKGTVLLFDDVLTSGKHFKCCEKRLREAIPGATHIMGLFVARRLLPNPSDEFSVSN